MKQQDITQAQNVIVGLAALASNTVTKASFALFAPKWGSDAYRRFQRNNETLRKSAELMRQVRERDAEELDAFEQTAKSPYTQRPTTRDRAEEEQREKLKRELASERVKAFLICIVLIPIGLLVLLSGALVK